MGTRSLGYYAGMALLAVCLAVASPAVAQEPWRELRQSEQERERLEHQQRLRTLQRDSGFSPTAPPTPAAAQRAEHCWPTTGLRLGGNRLISQGVLGEAIQPWLAPCMSVARINAVLAAITALYVEQGYIASRPHLAAAPEAGQSLDILISEGFVEAIELSDQSLPLSLQNAFAGMLGQPLQLRQLERGLDQLNRLRAFDLTADVEPGSVVGASRIVIRPLSRPNRWGLGLVANNGGREGFGRHQATLSASLDSPLELNDFILLGASTALKPGAASSGAFSLYYAVPYGPWTFTAHASRSQYRLPLRGNVSGGDLNGHSSATGLGLERSLWRDRQRLLSGVLRLERKHSDVFLADQFLDLQSPRLTNAEAGLNLLWLEHGVWSAYLGFTRGLSDWDSNASVQFPQAGAPRGRFSKWRGTLGYANAWPWAATTLQWQSSLAWQASADALPAAEQLLLTDEYAVRGLRDLSLSASSAASLRNTLSLKYPLTAGWALEPWAGLDFGWRRLEDQSEPLPGSREPARHLAGSSLGLALTHSDLRLSLDYQHALYLHRSPTPPGYWRLELSLKL